MTEAIEIELVDKIRPLITDGKYSARYIYHETAKAFNEDKVYVYFDIVDPGENFGIRLYRAYRVNSLIGQPRKNGRFTVKSRSELFLTLCNLFGERKSFRPDRISLCDLKNKIISVKVRTVVKDYKQRKLPECLKYSVIDKLIEIEAGGG